jgi:hypothetical protein
MQVAATHSLPREQAPDTQSALLSQLEPFMHFPPLLPVEQARTAVQTASTEVEVATQVCIVAAQSTTTLHTPFDAQRATREPEQPWTPGVQLAGAPGPGGGVRIRPEPSHPANAAIAMPANARGRRLISC